MSLRLSTGVFSLLLILCVGLATGCSSSRSTTEEAADRSAVVGTWEYEVEGFAPLSEGRIQIANQDGQLRGILRDQRRGRIRARVKVHDSRLELLFDDYRISGHIENNRFTGTLRRRQWSVSTRSRDHRRSRFRSASLFARRVQNNDAMSKPSVLECRSLLREKTECR